MKTMLSLILPAMAAIVFTLAALPAAAQSRCETCNADYEACAVSCDPNTRSGANCLAACERTLDRCLSHSGCGGDDGACPVVQSVLDLNVPAIQLRGTFTVNGAEPLPDNAHRGRIELRSDENGVVDLGSVHNRFYSALIVPGVYDVVYLYEQGDILPRNTETMLMEDVSFNTDAVWPIDVPSVLVMGDIMVDGAPAPNGLYESGDIKFRDTVTGASFPVGLSSDGSYMAMVIPGTYDVMWTRILGGDTVPLNGDALLVEGLVVSGLTEFDVDVPVVELTGTFKLNGATPPTGLYETGEVLLRDSATGDVFALGETRDRTWAARVVPGTYDVLYSKLFGGSEVPANEFALINSNVDLSTDGSLEIDIPVVTLSGDFSLDGAAFPAGIYDRAQLWLSGLESGDLVDLGSSLDGGYQIRVVPGSYDVYYQKVATTGLVPENPWALVQAGAKVPKGKGGARTLDIDVVSGLVDVDVAVWGDAPPGGLYETGVIVAVGAQGDEIELGGTHNGGGSAMVVEGAYDVHYRYQTGDEMPINGNAKVGEATATPLLVTQPVDLQPGLLAGVFFQNGVPFPATGDYGRFVLRDQVTGDRVEIGESTAGIYDEVLLSGGYDIIYDHVDGPSVVTNVGAHLGCVTFAPIDPYPGGHSR